MAKSKIAISIERKTLEKLDEIVDAKRFANRSRAIEAAIEAQIERHERRRLAHECGKLDPDAEKAMSEEGMAGELAEWPEY